MHPLNSSSSSSGVNHLKCKRMRKGFLLCNRKLHTRDGKMFHGKKKWCLDSHRISNSNSNSNGGASHL